MESSCLKEAGKGRVLLGGVLEVLGGGGTEPCWLVRTSLYSTNEMGSH